MMRMKKTQWQEVIDLNLTGVFICTQVVISNRQSLVHIEDFGIHETDICMLFFYCISASSKVNDEEKKGTHTVFFVLIIVKN